MAPLPSFLVRLASAFAAEHITQRLVASPAFNRMIARMLHEADHLPHRINGRPVPPWNPPVGSQFDLPQSDHGEPHDEPDPFAKKQAGAQRPTASSASTSTSQDFDSAAGGFRPRSKLRSIYGDEARRSAPADQTHTDRSSASPSSSRPPPEESQSERLARELRELQDQLRGKS